MCSSDLICIEMTRPNPFNADVSYNRATPNWYYFYNNYHALIDRKSVV
nr:hypothetical protein [Enterococcus faecium]